MQLLLQPSHIFAHLLDPLYAVYKVTDDGVCTDARIPDVGDYEEEAFKLLRRIGGMASTKEFDRLPLYSYSGLAREKVAACSEPVHEPNVGGKRKRSLFH